VSVDSSCSEVFARFSMPRKIAAAFDPTPVKCPALAE
jgi:hypothetical protein